MRPTIDRTELGSITIEGVVFEHDVVLSPRGKIKKRKKRLLRAIHGTSHVISLDEAKHVYSEGAERLIIGSGQYGMVSLSDEAVDYLWWKNRPIDLVPTDQAIRLWNQTRGETIGLFHVTC